MAGIKFTNFGHSLLAVGLGPGDTIMSVTGATGDRFPALGAGEYFYLTLEDALTNREIVKVTARSGDTLTIERAQDNTTARSWTAGDSVALRFNAAAIAEFLTSAAIGDTVQAYDATTAKTGATQSFTAPQRGTVTTDNDLSFDLSVTNNFTCTPAAGGALTFTNIAAGQSGFIKLVNGADYAVTAAANTKVTSTFLATISATGTYIISYFSDGTDVYCATAGAMA